MTDRLVKARTYAALNQAELGHALGISERTVKRYEAGARYKRGIILGWALACGVDPGWLENGDTGGSGVITPVTSRYAASLAA
jgi:DNA-binding XRE family transcriptional regulator